MAVDAQKSIGKGVCFLARGTTGYDACSGAAQILHEYDPQRDRHRPKLADGQWLNALIGAHETAQRFRIESTVGVGHDAPGSAEHARIPAKRTIPQLGKQPIEARWEIFADFPDLVFDDVVIIE